LLDAPQGPSKSSQGNAGDPHTLGYLIRCAQRMSQRGVSGFVLQDEAGRSTHFLWIGRYDGFHISEIDHPLDPISRDADVIFDCWTPAADRGHGYFAIAVRSAAARLRREGKTAWIFCDANNAHLFEASRRPALRVVFLWFVATGWATPPWFVTRPLRQSNDP
jgi:hypothetical protein